MARQSDRELVLRQTPALIWFVAGVFAVLGGQILLREGEILIAVLVVLGSAAVVLAFANTVTCVFDLGTGRFTRETRGLLRTRRVEYPVKEIRGVRLERSAARMSQAFRILLVMSSDERVPLTTAYSSGRGSKERIAQVIRDFLGIVDKGDAPIPGWRDLARAAFTTGGAQQVLDSYTSAIAEQEAAVQRDPDDIHARRQLATALAMQNRPAEARLHLEHARDKLLRAGEGKRAAELEEMLRRMDAASRGR